MTAEPSTTNLCSMDVRGRHYFEAKRSGSDPFAAIEIIVFLGGVRESITNRKSSHSRKTSTFSTGIGLGYPGLRRYAPKLLNVLGLHAAPAAKPVLAVIDLLRETNTGNFRKLPDDAPLDFIRQRWARLIFTDAGIEKYPCLVGTP